MRLAMLGVSHPRLGGERLATGRGRFVADVRPEALLEAAVLRSPHAHARVLRVDAARALGVPGVRAVLTAADVPASAVIPNRVPAPEGTAAYLQPAIARGVVRYVGEPVALVVADDRYIAEDALALVHVDWAPLPACASVAAALAPDAQHLFAGTDGNNVATIRMRVGDAGAALAGARLVLHERFRHPRQTAAALETRGLVAVPPDPRGGELHLIGSTKCIHINRGILAQIFGIPPGPYRVPAYACDLWSVVTNKPPVGTLRSPGRPECNFARERLLDLAATRLGLDPAELRRRNLIRPDEMPYDTGTTSFGATTVYDSGDFPALFEELLRRLDYDGARAEQRLLATRGVRRGIGVAAYVEKTGLGPFQTAHLEAKADATFSVDTGASSMGPGLETALAQILGGAPAVPPARFVAPPPDPASIESGVAPYGSRGPVMAGNAAPPAAAKLAEEAKPRAAALLGAPADTVRYARGVVSADGKSVSLAE